MQTTAQTAGLLLSAPLFAGATANRCATPNPIPGGFQFFGPGTEVFHNSAPGVFDPLDTDPSGITDFNGQIGYAVIDGTGTQTDASGEQQLGFEVDIRFMQGEYVAVDGKHYERTFGFLWLDVFGLDQSGQIDFTRQLHDLNPGILPNGLFWVTSCLPPGSAQVNPGQGRAAMQLRDFPIPDFGDLANGLSRGNSAPAVVTLEIEWTSSGNKQHFRNSDLGFDRRVVFNSAVVSWKAQTQTATFVSNPASQSLVHAEVGHERNGVFFS